jgi:ABC-2 type transport system permease protein
MRYLRIFFLLLRINFSRQMQYRSSMAIRFFGGFTEIFVTILFFKFLFNHIKEIEGWSFQEILILIASYDFNFSLLLGFFIKSLPKIEDYIMTGRIDSYLIKPISSQFLISFENISFGHLFQVIMPLLILIWTIVRYDLNLSYSISIFYLMSLGAGFIISYSLWMLWISLSFWTIKIKSVHEIYLSIVQLGKYPTSIYSKTVQIFLKYILPISFIASVPAEIWTSKTSLYFVGISFAMALLTFTLSRYVWAKGLQHYSTIGG